MTGSFHLPAQFRWVTVRQCSQPLSAVWEVNGFVLISTLRKNHISLVIFCNNDGRVWSFCFETTKIYSSICWISLKLVSDLGFLLRYLKTFYLVCALERVRQPDDFFPQMIMLFSIFTKLLNYSPFSCSSNPPVLHFAVFLWAGNAVVVLCWGLPSPCSGGSISVFQSPNLTSCFQKGMAFLLSAHTPLIWLVIFTFLKWLSLKI